MSDSAALPSAPSTARARFLAHADDPACAARRRAAVDALGAHAQDALSWMDLAHGEFADFRFGAGHLALDVALALDPDLLAARWARFQLPEDVAPETPEHADRFRRRWSEGLAAFEALDFHEPRWRAQVWSCIGQCTAFYRHYLDDGIDEQRRYGALLQRMMAALDPGIDVAPPPRTRRRVVFVSSHLHDHTVGRLFVPLIAGLDPARFEVHAMLLSGTHDAVTDTLAARATLHRGPLPAPAWRQRIATLAPDAIVYPDIGMDPLTQALAALRLAPLQAVLWGHPVTTGLPSIDLYLSPDGMEIPQAQAHYTERLVRLPGLGHGLAAPVARPPPTPLGGAPGTIELFCAQAVYKLMPEQDLLFARLLARLPRARLHLVGHQHAHVRDWLAARIGRALRAQGLDPAQRIVMHPLQSLAGFIGLARGCDFALDSVGWSGGMSALDLLGAGVPIVTLPGRSMRCRQTAAMLRLLDAPQLIARDAEDYLDKAVALASNPDQRRRLGERLYAARHRLHDTAPVIAALERVLGGS